MLTVIYVSTDSVYAAHPIKKQISDDPEDWLTINAKPMNSTDILVFGHVPRGVIEPVQLTVASPLGKQVTNVQVSVDSKLNYWTVIKTNPQLWNVNGTYAITVYQDTGKLPFFRSSTIEVVSGFLVLPEFRISTPLVLLVSVAVIVTVIVVLYQKGKFSKLNLKQYNQTKTIGLKIPIMIGIPVLILLILGVGFSQGFFDNVLERQVLDDPIENEIFSTCVTPTIFDPETSSCILDDTLGNKTHSKCGTGTIFHPQTNSCILDDPIVNEILSNCVTGTIFDPQTNSCILDDTIANEILSKCDTGTIFDPETNSCILEDLMARFLKSRE